MFGFSINVDRDRAIAQVSTNRANHVAEYQGQIVGWQQAMNEYNQQMQEWSQNEGTGKRPEQPYKPEDYTADYDKLLAVLYAHVDDTIVLDDERIKQIVHNEFGWSKGFLTTTQRYNNH